MPCGGRCARREGGRSQTVWRKGLWCWGLCIHLDGWWSSANALIEFCYPPGGGGKGEIGIRTLSRPAHLFLCIHTRHRGTDLKPHRSTSIPALHILSFRNLRKIVLCWAWVVDLLSRHIMDCRAGWYGDDIRRCFGSVAADICDGWVLVMLGESKKSKESGLAGVGECTSIPCFVFAFLVSRVADQSFSSDLPSTTRRGKVSGRC
jgi:hypothetical protein